MAGDDTLTKALVDVRARRAALQGDYERIGAELAKLRAAEAALTAIVDGIPLAGAGAPPVDAPRLAEPGAVSGGRRGVRGPRANSAKGRLKALLDGAGPQGFSHAEIAERLPDVSPNTLNTYLSLLVTGGEALRKGDFYTAAAGHEEDDADDADEADHERADAPRSAESPRHDADAAE
jgi:hypothetical protein